MPDDLFYPVGVVSCILVFTAHTPHDSDEHHESWFGYWKDDGFRKDRVKGRVPESEEAWKIKKNEWVSAFRKKEIPGFSVWKKVDAGNEWCAESYLETDYSQLCDQPFINNTRDFAGFLVKEGDFDFARKISTDQAAHRSLSEHDWKWFSYSWLFELKKGKRLTKESMENGDTLFIGSTESNNGVTAKINREPIHHGNVISVTYNGSVGEAFYQPKPFWASDDVNVFYPKFELNEYRAMFLITLIRKEKYRFNYGRKWHTDRMLESKIKLPVTSLGEPDWAFMESYIKGLPFSGATHN